MFLFVASAVLILSGVNYTVTLSSSDPTVIGLLVSGFAALVGLIVWETFGNPKQPVTPRHLFTADKGRELTFPFICGFVVTMFYYAINIIYPSQIAIFYTTPTTTLQDELKMTLPANLGICVGMTSVILFSNKIKHYKWQLVITLTGTTLFGALMALGNPSNKITMMAFVGICQIFYGWAQVLTITWIQFGAPQTELGVSGGLAGVARFAGGAVAISVYQTVLANSLQTKMAQLVPAAALSAGLPAASLPALMQALPLGAAALQQVPGITAEVAAAAGVAFVRSYQSGLRTTALVSLAFGGLAIGSAFLCNDVEPKMTDKIEVFLENTKQAEKNQFH